VTLKILEGDDIYKFFKEHGYFETALCKMYLRNDEGDDQWYYRKFYPSEKQSDFWINAFSANGNIQDILKNLEPNNWYFITVYSMHHQMLFNPVIVAVNFDCKNKKVMSPWRYDQCYPGYPYKTSEDYKNDARTFDDMGVPA